MLEPVTPAFSPTKGIVRDSRDEQPLKADEPMVVTLSGMVMLVSPLQPRKAFWPMLIKLSGIVTLVKPLQL